MQNMVGVVPNAVSASGNKAAVVQYNNQRS